MRSATRAGFRIAGLMAMTFLIAHCGDSSVHIRTGRGVNPTAGTFTGETDQGGSITVVVDSIRSIAFQCEGDDISQTFDPRVQIDSDGTFSVKFTDAGRQFHVTGTFTDNDTLEGFIDDADNHCDTGFTATRGGVTPPTSTPHVGPTPTGVVEPTSTEVGPTSTAVGPTSTSETGTPTGATPTGATPTGPTPTGPTPSGGVLTPTPASTGGGGGCPTKLTAEGLGDQAVLDTGTSGFALDQKVVTHGTITVSLNCPGSAPGSCGDCAVGGPIASTTTINNERCSTDASIKCTNGTPASACPNGGSCVFFFGAPLPLVSGGVGVCVTNQVVGTITGTANPDTGHGASTVLLSSKVFTAGSDNYKPCPVCGTPPGGAFGSTGTCDEGQNAGKPCTVDSTSPNNLGNTSFDCPPNPGANVSGAGGLQINLNPTTEVAKLSPSASTACTSIPFNGKPCYCPGQHKANECDDALCPADATGKGECSSPIDLFCATPALPMHSCLSNTDCPNMDCNVTKIRGCQGKTDSTFAIIGDITRTGTASTTNPTLVSAFCVAAVSAPAVNTAGGLPGPGALVLPSKVCYSDTCSFP